MKPADLRRYVITTKDAGWGIFIIDTSNGYFSVISDWGCYAHLWSDPGGEFRAFLTELNPDYLHDKLMIERPDRRVYDDEATHADITKYIQEHKEDFACELEILEDHDEVCTLEDFHRWIDSTSLPEPWEFHREKMNPHCWRFCTKLYPEFVKALKVELELETCTVPTASITSPP